VNALPSRLLIVTDRHQARRPLDDIVSESIEAGARWFWLRDRDMDRDERRSLAHRLAEIAHRAGGRLSIGGDAELAAEVGTGAVHVRSAADAETARRRLGASVLVGVSAHSLADAIDAQTAGADYVTLSPIFATASKPGYGPALGLEALRQAAKAGIPVVALGGMDEGNGGAAREAGAAGIAVMGRVMRADDPADVVGALLALCSRSCR